MSNYGTPIGNRGIDSKGLDQRGLAGSVAPARAQGAPSDPAHEPIVRQLQAIASQILSQERANAAVSAVLEQVQSVGATIYDVLVPSANAAYVDIPKVYLTGIVAHLMITAKLVVLNPAVVPDVTLGRLAAAGGEQLGVPLPDVAKRRPDLSTLDRPPLKYGQFWEIKSAATIARAPRRVQDQMDSYAQWLAPGGMLNGMSPKGNASFAVGSTRFSCDFELREEGLIQYRADFEIDKEIERLGRRVVELFIRQLQASSKARSEQLLEKPVYLALLALAILVILLILFAPEIVAGALLIASRLTMATVRLASRASTLLHRTVEQFGALGPVGASL